MQLRLILKKINIKTRISETACEDDNDALWSRTGSGSKLRRENLNVWDPLAELASVLMEQNSAFET